MHETGGRDGAQGMGVSGRVKGPRAGGRRRAGLSGRVSLLCLLGALLSPLLWMGCSDPPPDVTPDPTAVPSSPTVPPETTATPGGGTGTPTPAGPTPTSTSPVGPTPTQGPDVTATPGTTPDVSPGVTPTRGPDVTPTAPPDVTPTATAAATPTATAAPTPTQPPPPPSDADHDGYSVAAGDCNDADATIYPGATEKCDGKDNNCNTQTDEGVQGTYFGDSDKDGYGSPTVTTKACAAPTGYVATNTDCDDTNAAIHPGASETVCDGLDQNCNGATDDHPDADSDGYDVCATGVSGADSKAADCNDADITIYPGAVDVTIDGKDANCDGKFDTITTIAGAGNGDGKQASQAQLSGPRGVALDAKGNILIADAGESLIRKVDTTGIISTVAGSLFYTYGGDGGPATSASLAAPAWVLPDAAGNLYIADARNQRIRYISASTGVISTLAGTGERGYGGDGGQGKLAKFTEPMGLAISGRGLFIADAGNHRIRRLDLDTGVITTAAGNGDQAFGGDGGQATSASFKTPSSVTFDSKGDLYISDSGNHRIRKVTMSTGIISTVAGNGKSAASGDGSAATAASLSYPGHVLVDSLGNLYIADTNNNKIRKVDTSGKISTFAGTGRAWFGGDGGLATYADLQYPTAVVMDATGRFLISDSRNNRVRRIDVDGKINTIAGGFSGDGGLATAALINYPSGITRDKTGNLYISDTINSRVRKIDGNGIITTYAGTTFNGYYGDNGPATAARLSMPTAVLMDSANNLYIADTFNHRIRAVDASGTIRTLAGNGKTDGKGDGGQATAASMVAPDDLALADGILYVTEGGNGRIRAINLSTGIISTLISSLSRPTALTADGKGNLIASSTQDCELVKVVIATKATSKIAGTGTCGYSGEGLAGTTSMLDSPMGLLLDSASNLYVADSFNHLIRRLDASKSTLTSIAGTLPVNAEPVPGFAGDGGPALKARLQYPSRMVFGNNGQLYLVDTPNLRVRLITP